MPLNQGKSQILWTESRSGAMFFNHVFIAYLCMRKMSRIAIEDKP